MTALDACEPPIIRALQKDGWQIVSKPHMIRLVGRNVFADMRLQRTTNGSSEMIIVVEVKCFTNPSVDFDEFYGAVGQYQFYRNALLLNQMPFPLYLALPADAYTRLILQPAITTTLKQAGVQLIVVDTDKEEIVSWIR